MSFDNTIFTFLFLFGIFIFSLAILLYVIYFIVNYIKMQDTYYYNEHEIKNNIVINQIDDYLIKKKYSNRNNIWIKKKNELSYPLIIKIFIINNRISIKAWCEYKSPISNFNFNPYLLLFTGEQLILRRDIRNIEKIIYKK